MLPAAPARFSTITDWPSDTRMRSLKIRASTSAGPAAGNGTTIVIGRVGKTCATVLRVAAGRIAAAPAKCRNRRRGRFILFLLAIVAEVADRESGSTKTQLPSDAAKLIRESVTKNCLGYSGR